MSGEFDSPPPAEEFPVQKFEDKAIIGVPSDVHLYNTPDFKRKLLELLADEEVQTIAVDMAACEFADSTFFGVLVGGVKRARVDDRQITLRGMGNRNIRKLFEIQGFDRIFLYEDEAFTKDIEEIKTWAEGQGAKLAVDKYGTPRLIFPNQETYTDLDDLSWKLLDEQLSAGQFAFIYQPEGQPGTEYPFTQFVKIQKPEE